MSTGLDSEHDPFNEPALRHPRAQELIHESLWSCTDELAPFGSDEGWEAYYEFRRWRAEHRDAPMVDCISWILQDGEEAYPDDDFFTVDGTLIASILGQLVDEGRIDAEVKPYARRALERQSRLAELFGSAADRRRRLLQLVSAAIEQA